MSVLSIISADCPRIKILELFAKDPDEMLYLADIYKTTGISQITIINHLNKFYEEGIIDKKGKDGRKQYYQLNKENPIAKIMLSLEKHIEEAHLVELLKKETGEGTVPSLKEGKRISPYSSADASGNPAYTMPLSNSREKDNQ